MLPVSESLWVMMDRLVSPQEPGEADAQQLMKAAVPTWLVVKPYRAVLLRITGKSCS